MVSWARVHKTTYAVCTCKFKGPVHNFFRQAIFNTQGIGPPEKIMHGAVKFTGA